MERLSRLLAPDWRSEDRAGGRTELGVQGQYRTDVL